MIYSTMVNMEIRDCIKLAEDIVSKYNPLGLSPFPYQNIVNDKKDLKIFLSDKLQERISGAIVYEKSSNEFIILVNKNKPITRQNFTIAHELGHYFIHHDLIKSKEVIVDDDTILEGRALFRVDGAVSTTVETEANNFAASLIMPKNQVEKAWAELKSIEECANVFNVSVLAMTIRLTKLKLIPA